MLNVPQPFAEVLVLARKAIQNGWRRCLPALRALAASGHEICGGVSRPEHANLGIVELVPEVNLLKEQSERHQDGARAISDRPERRSFHRDPKLPGWVE